MALKQLPCLEIEVEVRGGDTKNNEPGPQRHDKIKKRRKRGTKIAKKLMKRKHIVDINKNHRTEHLINSYKSTSDNVENTNIRVCVWLGWGLAAYPLLQSRSSFPNFNLFFTWF